MSNEIAVAPPLPPITKEQDEAFERAIEACAGLAPVELRTVHHLHAGVYSRTIYVPKGTFVVGLRIALSTQLIASGHFQLTDGGVTQEFEGYHVFDGGPGRRAAVRTITDSAFTMLFATNAKTVEEAESEFTDEPERLLTRQENLICQERQSR